MKLDIKFLLIFGWALALAHIASSQCTVWVGTSFEADAKDAHVLYVDKLKAKDYDGAYEFWKKAFELAPAADGKRDDHYFDGVTILMHKYKNSTDEAEKKRLAVQINQLYDQAVECLQSGAITLSKTPTDKRIGFLRGRQAFDQFYTLRTPYSEVKKALDESIAKSGSTTEYIVLDPYAHIMVNLFSNEEMQAEEVRTIHQQLIEIADYNIANNKTYGSYYQQAKDAMNGTMSSIERNVYDCEYFKAKFKPEFEQKEHTYERLRDMMVTLRQQGCDTTDAFIQVLNAEYKVKVDSVNAERLADFRKNNPAYRAKELYDQGQYKQAINKYEEAIDKVTDVDQQASYKLAIASIQFRKLGQYSTARNTAYEAAKMKSGWGDPYMLIADMYASSARNCGDAWNQRLAVLAAIEKYRYARSVDSGVTGEANKRIGHLSGALPEKSQGHMQGYQEGQKMKVKCWIGETVTLKYK